MKTLFEFFLGFICCLLLFTRPPREEPKVCVDVIEVYFLNKDTRVLEPILVCKN